MTDGDGSPECINRNVIQFSVPKITDEIARSEYAGTVALIDHFTHFEIHVDTHPNEEAELWQLAHDAVFAGLNKAGKTIGYKNNTPVPAIVCPAHLTTPHPAVVDKTVWKCSKFRREFGTVCKDTIPWMTTCNTHSESVCDVLHIYTYIT